MKSARCSARTSEKWPGFSSARRRACLSCAAGCQSESPRASHSVVNILLSVGTGAASLGLLGPFLRVAILFTTEYRVVGVEVGI